MGDNKKEDKQLLFPHNELATKPANEVWMRYETKLHSSARSNYPNQVGWMLNDGLDEKKPLCGLMMVPDFKQWYGELDRHYHPGVKPLKRHYRNPPVPPTREDVLRRVEYDQEHRFYTQVLQKYREKEAAKILEFQKAQG